MSPPHKLLILTALLATAPLLTHSQAPATPKIEVSSAKILPSAGHTLEELQQGIGLTSIGPSNTNRFTAKNVTLSYLIQDAYDMDVDDIVDDIVNAPSWLQSQQYDVEIKAEGDTGLSREQWEPLIRQFLEDRFHLKVHHATRDVSGYALVIAKGGPHLTNAEKTYGNNQMGMILPNRIETRSASVGALALMLRRPIGAPVIDKTGITGLYDLKLSFTPADAQDSTLPSIFTAVEEQLGLRLQPQKVPVAIFIIDSVDKAPTEN